MATLVSPGVSVTITDESFFVPASAPTVPLIFIATADEKLQSDGITPAQGTYEYDVVRTVTSLSQSTQLYGVPRFLEDVNGQQFHGDARNEYGLFALNQFLGVSNRAYVVRANVNLDDDLTNVLSLWDTKMLQAQTVLENLINDYITSYNATHGLVAGGSPAAITTVDAATYLGLVTQATQDLFNSYSFTSIETYFYDDQSLAPLPIYASGYNLPSTGLYNGLTYIANNIGGSPSYPGGGTVAGEFTPTEGGNLLVAAADDFKYTVEFMTGTSLGASDSVRRAAIVTALKAAITSNTEVRSDNFDYNLVLCPGYPEVVSELAALVTDINEEALIVADTPMNLNPDGITNPTTGWAVSAERVISSNVAYYYPSALATNLDGKDVTVAASGVALRTYAYNDNVAFLWTPPAGTRRGRITGISNLGYVSGTLGTATTFVELNINQGQKDALYTYSASGGINPLMNIQGYGFVVMGQKTSTGLTASAVDRVNVSRLTKYVKRQLRRYTLPFVFEPNDSLTRANLKAVVDNFLGDLIVKRGLYDFATICDDSNNDPARIDRNELYIDVIIKPVKAAEFIYIPIRIVSTGASI